METLAEGRRHSASPEAMKKHEGCENAQSCGIEPLKLHAKVWKVIWGMNDYRDHLGAVVFFLVEVSSYVTEKRCTHTVYLSIVGIDQRS